MVSALGRTYLLEANILKGADSAGNDKLERNGLVKPSSKLVSTLNDCQTRPPSCRRIRGQLFPC